MFEMYRYEISIYDEVNTLVTAPQEELKEEKSPKATPANS